MDTLAPVRFKFLLGEVHLHSWRPRFVAAQASALDEAPAKQALPPDAAGVWWQGTEAGRFPLGWERTRGWLRYVPREDKLFHVRVEGDFEAYLSAWSTKARYNLKRSVRKLQDRNPGQPLLEIFTEPDQMEHFLRQAAAISEHTYQSKLLQSGLTFSEALLGQMQARATDGEARGYLLRDQGEAIAFAWCAGRGERLTYEVIGYQESAAALSPGSVLLYLILEDLFALQRFQVFDFGVGDAPYKRQFATGVLEFAEVYFFTDSWRHRLLVGTHWLLDRFSAGVGRLLERWGLKARVRQWIRRLRG
ncbi:MAG: GNAT family N-acetyltransferase [Burkholderiales bacterium]|uniref:GNAT family N-acetyltransferase n=1 Tax=Inhella sp. TaxID=1921806 RepID=UPI001AC4E2BF|nr:GNAT family N-acetyltransferase [Burkholderiales bacterium]